MSEPIKASKFQSSHPAVQAAGGTTESHEVFKKGGSDSGENIQTDPSEKIPPRVVKVDVEVDRSPQPYKVPRFEVGVSKSYGETKSKFGPLAATDPDRNAKKQKDSRFYLNSLLKGPLKVEEEERKVIDEIVKTRIAAIEEDSRNKAFIVGREEGDKRGYADALEQFRTECKERAAMLNRLIMDLEQAKREIFKENERWLLNLVYEISRMVLLKEVQTDRQYLVRLAQELIERTGLKENIRIKINAQDKESIDMISQELKEKISGLKEITVEVSESVKRGGCRVETQWNFIDGCLETQLAGIHDAIVGVKIEEGQGSQESQGSQGSNDKNTNESEQGTAQGEGAT